MKLGLGSGLRKGLKDKCNANKTDVVVCTREGKVEADISDKKIHRLKQVEKFKHLKPLSHRIVRLLDRAIGCYLVNVRPIGNVCYDRQHRSHTAIGHSSWW